MTLEEYKSQVKEIQEATKNFNGTQQEAIELFENFAKKYPDLNKFNIEAIQCEDLKEFKDLADSFGMKFSSDKSAEKLFSTLQENKKQLDAEILKYKNGAKLSDEDLSNVTGGKSSVWRKIGGAFLILGGSIAFVASAAATLATSGISLAGVAPSVGAIVAGKYMID